MGRRFNHFHKLSNDAKENATLLVESYQVWFLDAAIQLAPVDKGDLRNSGTLADGWSEFERRIAFTAAHAPHQEYGTIHMPPQPFMRPARDALRGAFQRDLKTVFGG